MANNKRIILLHHTDFSNRGGVETYYYNLTQNFIKKKIPFNLFFLAERNFSGLNKFPRWKKKITAFLKKKLSKNEIDFFLIRHPFLAVTVKKIFPEIKVLYIPASNQSDSLLYNYLNGNYPLKERIFSLFYWLPQWKYYQEKALNLADKIVFFSHSSQNWIDKKKKYAHKSKIIPPGTPFLREDKINFHKFPNLVLFVGRLEKLKEPIIMVDLALKLKNFLFVIVGNGPEKRALEKKINKYKLKNIYFSYTLNPYQFYQTASLFLFPSIKESFGHTLIEALYFGLPVVGFKADGRKIINSNSEIFPPFTSYLESDLINLENITYKIKELAKISVSERKNLHFYAKEKFNYSRHIDELLKFMAYS